MELNDSVIMIVGLLTIGTMILGSHRGLAKRLDRHDRQFEHVDERFDQVDARFVKVDERFDRVDARLDRVDDRFDLVDERFERMEANLGERIERARFEACVRSFWRAGRRG